MMADVELTVSNKGREIIRDLARKCAEIAADPCQEQTAQLWTKLNRLERTRPLVLLHDGTQLETGDRVTCTTDGEAARQIEHQLLQQIWHWENMRDDTVWSDRYDVPIAVHITDHGIEPDWTKPDHVFGASHFNQVIPDGDDPSRLKMPEVTVDWDDTNERFDFVSDVLGDILQVNKVGVQGSWFAPLDTFITWRGIEQTFIDMIDAPQWLHAWLEGMCQFDLSMYDQLEKLGVLSLNNREICIGSGGLGYTDLLPQPDFDGEHVRTKDMWGHATTQIFSEVSPAMHEEFALQYEARVMELFGLCNYGCCEPLDLKVDVVLKHIPSVRKLSMSPKANYERGAEALGKKAVFSYKPNPAILGVPNWDVSAAREQLRDVYEKTKHCVVEVIMKDLHTVRGEVSRMSDWVYMAKDLAQEYA